jgi:integrase
MWRHLQALPKQPKLSDEARADIIRRREAGETLHSIGKIHKVHLGTVHRIHKERLTRPEPARDSRRDIAERYGLHLSTITAHEKHMAEGPKRYRPRSMDLLEFIILTIPRKMEAAEIKRDDIDWNNKLWIKERHKARTAGKTDHAHTVILSDAAMAILHRMDELQDAEGIKSEYMFPGQKPGRPFSETVLNQILTRNFPEYRDEDGRKISIHGFRRSFGNWSVDNSHGKIWGEIDSEMALAHKLGDDTRNAYKGDAKRLVPGRAMMEDWAAHCGGHDGHSADVLPFPQQAKA